MSRKKKPLYQQLYEQLRSSILQGQFSSGDRLPSKRQLAQNLGLSQNTVNTAYQQLVDEGYIESRERSGFFVLTLALPKLKEKRKAEIEQLSEETPAPNNPIIDFSSRNADPELFPYDLFRRISSEIWRDRPPELLSSPPAQGHAVLRREIAIYLARNRGLSVSPEQIVVQANSVDLLALIVRLLPNHCVGLENPGFPAFYYYLHERKLPYKLLPLGSQGIEPDKIKIQGAQIISVSPTHQFPSGSIMPVGQRIKLLRYASAAPDRWLMEDDYDSEFRYEGLTVPSLKSLDRDDKVIYLGNFSKAICPGIRVSYLVLPRILLEKYQKLEASFRCPVSGFTQILLARFLEGGQYERHLNRLRKRYRAKRELMLSCLDKSNLPLEILGSEAGFQINLRLHLDKLQIKTKDATKYTENLREKLRKSGIIVPFLSDFLIKDQKMSKSCSKDPVLILGFSDLKEEEIQNGIRCLLKIIEGEDCASSPS